MDERGELIDLVAQAVIDKIEERDRISGLANLVVARVLALQAEEAALRTKEREARLANSENGHTESEEVGGE